MSDIAPVRRPSTHRGTRGRVLEERAAPTVTSVRTWPRYLLARAGSLVFILFGLSLTIFFMVRLVPGDPARIVAGDHATAALLNQIRAQLGLNRPVPDQLGEYYANLFSLKLGHSFVTGQSVSQLIAQRLPHTAELAGLSLVVVLGVGIPLGIFAGALTHEERHPAIDALFTSGAGVLSAVPSFATGTVLVYLFGVALHWFPVAGDATPDSALLPVIAISLLPTVMLARIVRLESLNVLSQDYLRAARSRRLSPARLYLRHVLPNVLTAALTVASVFFAQLIGGTIVVENLFAWPGLGTALTNAVLNHDYPVVQGITLLLGVVVVMANAIVDMALAAIDPRTILRPSR